MHNAPLRQVIGVGVVLSDAVIPNRHVVRLPAPAHLEVRFSNVSKQEAEQRLALIGNNASVLSRKGAVAVAAETEEAADDVPDAMDVAAEAYARDGVHV